MSKLMFDYFQNPDFHYLDGNPLYFVNQDRLGTFLFFFFLFCQTVMSQEGHPMSIRFKLDVDELLQI